MKRQSPTSATTRSFRAQNWWPTRASNSPRQSALRPARRSLANYPINAVNDGDTVNVVVALTFNSVTTTDLEARNQSFDLSDLTVDLKYLGQPPRGDPAKSSCSGPLEHPLDVRIGVRRVTGSPTGGTTVTGSRTTSGCVAADCDATTVLPGTAWLVDTTPAIALAPRRRPESACTQSLQTSPHQGLRTQRRPLTPRRSEVHRGVGSRLGRSERLVESGADHRLLHRRRRRI